MAYSDSLADAFGGALVVAGAAAATTEGEALLEERRAGDADEAAALEGGGRYVLEFFSCGTRKRNCEKLFHSVFSASSFERNLYPEGNGSDKQRLPRQRELSGDQEASPCFFLVASGERESEERFPSLRNSLPRGLLTSATARTPARLRDEVGRACTEARRDCAKGGGSGKGTSKFSF